MIKEFKEFISKGNVVDLAVAVILGVAFGAVVKSFTDDILGQLIAALGGTPDYSQLGITLREVEQDGRMVPVVLKVGAFLTAIINFLIVALSLFLVVKAINRLENLRRRKEEVNEEEKKENAEIQIELLTEIRDQLSIANGGARVTRP